MNKIDLNQFRSQAQKIRARDRYQKEIDKLKPYVNFLFWFHCTCTILAACCSFALGICPTEQSWFYFRMSVGVIGAATTAGTQIIGTEEKKQNDKLIVLESKYEILDADVE